MAFPTDKKCPECDLELEERSDKRPVLLTIRGQVVEQQAREFRCLNGHVWLQVKL